MKLVKNGELFFCPTERLTRILIRTRNLTSSLPFDVCFYAQYAFALLRHTGLFLEIPLEAFEAPY